MTKFCENNAIDLPYEMTD